MGAWSYVKALAATLSGRRRAIPAQPAAGSTPTDTAANGKPAAGGAGLAADLAGTAAGDAGPEILEADLLAEVDDAADFLEALDAVHAAKLASETPKSKQVIAMADPDPILKLAQELEAEANELAAAKAEEEACKKEADAAEANAARLQKLADTKKNRPAVKAGAANARTAAIAHAQRAEAAKAKAAELLAFLQAP